MKRSFVFTLLLPILLFVVTGCASTRVTTTERTAVEQALLTTTANDVVMAIEPVSLQGRTFEIATDEFDGVEKNYIVSALTERMLAEDGRLPSGDERAQVRVHPRIDYHNIDDARFMIGFPEVPIPVPGAGTFQTPEIAFFKRDAQKGRTGMKLFAVETDDNSLLFSSEPPPSMRNYTRWTLLIFFNFRTTNLDKPF